MPEAWVARVTESAGGGSLTIAHIESLVGGAGADAITLTDPLASQSLDLGDGADRLTLANAANAASLFNIETVVGGSGADAITLSTAMAGGSVDLGAGADVLTLGDVSNSLTVAHVETVTGGIGDDAVTLSAPLFNGAVDLGAGSDTLKLGNFTNVVTIANVETVTGGAGADTLTVASGTAAMIIGGGGVDHITGHDGDLFVFDQKAAASYSTIMNFNEAGGDRIGLDTGGDTTLAVDAYSLTGPLEDGVNITSAADSSALHVAALDTGGGGGFVYEQDTGGLYYSATGDFTGGGVLIGVITTNGSTPWTYDFAAFREV